MIKTFSILSALALVVGVTVIAGETKGECAKACAKTTPVGETAKEACCDKAKTAVGETAKEACCDKAKTAVGEEAKAECTSAKTLTLKINGAECEESCAAVDKTLTSLEGVTKSETCSESHLTKVSYDATKFKPEQLMAAIKKAGLKVEGQQVSLPVEGMACASCSGKVSKVLTSLEGVISGEACHQSKKATVMFDPAKVKESQIIAAINHTGFKVQEAQAAQN